MLKDSDVLRELGVKNGDKLYFKDLGPQIGWSTVSCLSFLPLTDFRKELYKIDREKRIMS